MSFRGIVRPAQAAVDALAARVDNALGYPRCERLSGTLQLDGAPIAVTAPICRCTVASAPHATCVYSTRSEARPVALVSGWAYPVRESKASVMAALTGAEHAQIVTIADGDVLPPSAASVAEGK
jgi:hypothetical protein